MFKKEYDIFIAYHGSYEKDSSRATSEKIYKYLEGNGYSCFYFPYDEKDSYKSNIVDVIKSRTFLLICNNSMHILNNGALDKRFHYELSTEIDAFYGLTQLGDDVLTKDAKVIVLGNKWARGDEEKIHPLFMGRTHIYGKEEKEYLQEIKDWLDSRLEEQKNRLGEVSFTEISKTYMTRKEMMVDVSYKKLIENAKNIRAVGISNSDIMRKLEYSVFKNIIGRGGEIKLAFLKPTGQYNLLREHEEGLKRGRIRSATEYNLNIARDIYEELTDFQRASFKVYLYDRCPRVNIVLADNVALLQYYDSFNRGMYNPGFFIKKETNKDMYNYCEKKFEEIISVAEEYHSLIPTGKPVGLHGGM